MQAISLNLLGTFQVLIGEEPVTDFATDKVRALLCYLALEAARPHLRATLAALLWPHQSPEHALDNLRKSLYRLRKALDQVAPGASIVVAITRQTVQFVAPQTSVDVVSFQHLLVECQTHPHADLHICDACLIRLAQAAELYRGELLAGFGLADAPAFEEWLLFQREELHHQAIQMLMTLTDAWETRADPRRALALAGRILALDPYREETHRQKMRLLVQSGMSNQALEQYEGFRRLLKQELDGEPEAETTALYEWIRSGGGGKKMSVLDALALSPPLHNLPAPLTPLVGRAGALAEIAGRLREPDARLLTLVGAGGVGKTRLALAVGWAFLGMFPDGVYFVSLASLRAPAALASAIAAALDLNLQGRDPRQALLQSLRDRCLLLILDNFEHLLAGVDIVVDLLQAAPQAQIVATSRQRLNLRGEHLYRVQPMASVQEATLAEAANASAVHLFVQSARRARPGFMLNAENLTVVLRICSLVQGMPLGLELAAAWTELLPVEEIAREIEKSADFLAVDWSDVPERQRSMRAVFEWSWRLLTDIEQQVLRQLSIFRGGFSRQAAESVAGTSLRVLTSLVQKSLLQQTEINARDMRRYELHELLRQFAAEQLDAAGERAAVEARHSAHYLAFVAGHERRLARTQPREALAEIYGEIDNVRQAWSWAASYKKVEILDQSAYTLWHFYLLTGLWSEGAQLFRLAVEHIYSFLESISGTVKAMQMPDGQSVFSKLMAMHATFLISLSKHEQALALAQRAIRWGQASGGVEGEALGYLVQGQALRRMGQTGKAQPLLEQAVSLAQRHKQGDLFPELLADIELRAYGWLCSIALTQDDYAVARHYAEQSLRISQTLGKLYWEMTATTDLIDIAQATGDLKAVPRHCDEVLRLARRLGNRWGEAISQQRLADVARSQGDYTQAHNLLRQSLAIYQEIGDPMGEINSVLRLGRLQTLMGNYALAQEWFDHYRRVIQAAEKPARETFLGLLPLALLAHDTGDYAQALTYAEEGWQLAQQLDGRASQAQALVILGLVQVGLYRLDEAARSFKQALTFYTALGQLHATVEPRAGLAHIALAQDDRRQALQHAEAIVVVLQSRPLAGLDEPFRVYLTCYRTLTANQDPRAAAVIDIAYALLHQYAERITDAAWRHSFLENVAVHRELQAAYLSRDSLC